MEFGLWHLNHRDEDQLLNLAQLAGYEKSKISIEQESEGVNLFMRIKHS